tara:strand:- start:128 stop:379 length:252 start_codon:yes stop_codon:yes gene_type:complete
MSSCLQSISSENVVLFFDLQLETRGTSCVPYFFAVSLLLLRASMVALVAQSGIFLNVIESLRSLTLGMPEGIAPSHTRVSIKY